MKTINFLIYFKNRKLDGFSLLELLVVIAIIGIVLSFIVPNVINRPSEARKTKIVNDIMVLESALELYKLDNGNYPSEDIGLEILANDQKKLESLLLKNDKLF